MSTDEHELLVGKLVAAYSRMPQQFEIDPDAAKRAVSVRRRRSRSLAGVAGAAAVAAIAGVAWTQAGQSDNTSPITAGPVVVRSNGALELDASSTARDWVRTADQVVVAKVTAESRGSATAAGDGTGDEFVERAVTIEVVSQIWTPPGGPRLSVGGTAELGAAGWVSHADGSASPLAFDGAPRLEVGHTYLIALVGSVCTTDTTGGTSWAALGSDAVLPTDSGRIGFGESEGRTVNGDVDQSTRESLERRHLGDPPESIIPELVAAESDLRPEGSSC